MDRQSKQGSCKGRPNYPTEFKMRLAKAASEPGVSVRAVLQGLRA